MAAPKVKPNAATQAVRDARAVSKAAGERYTRKAGGEIKVNAATQAKRIERATARGAAKPKPLMKSPDNRPMDNRKVKTGEMEGPSKEARKAQRSARQANQAAHPDAGDKQTTGRLTPAQREAHRTEMAARRQSQTRQPNPTRGGG